MGKETILIIDDSREIIKHLSTQLLPAFGYNTVHAPSGDKGLELIRQIEPDLVMLDLNLPGMTGLDVLQTLATDKIDVPVVLMTGYGSEKAAIEAFRLGVKDYLVKPFTVDEVIGTIERALVESRLRHDKERLIAQLGYAEAEMRNQVNQMNMLLDIGKTIVSLPKLEDVLKHALEVSAYVTNAESSVVWLYEKETNFLRSYSRQSKNYRFAKLDMPVKGTTMGQVFLTGRLIDDQQFSGQGIRVGSTSVYTRALLYVPLTVNGEAIGVLGVHNQAEPRAFSERDQFLLSSIADYVAIALKNAQRMLESENNKMPADFAQAKTQFVSTVSHDLRSPLNSIIGFATTLNEIGPLENKQEQFVQRIVGSARRMLDLVNDLLDLAWVNTGLETSYESCDLARIVQEVVADLQGQAIAKNVRLNLMMRRQLSLVQGNPVQLRQAVSNLIDNAIKYSPAGEEVKVSVFQKNDTLLMRVKDNGSGIAESDLPYIFEEFYRVKGERYVNGSGLGLTLVRSIADSHAGRVTVSSKEQQGSLFTLQLPIDKRE